MFSFTEQRCNVYIRYACREQRWPRFSCGCTTAARRKEMYLYWMEEKKKNNNYRKNSMYVNKHGNVIRRNIEHNMMYSYSFSHKLFKTKACHIYIFTTHILYTWNWIHKRRRRYRFTHCSWTYGNVEQRRQENTSLVFGRSVCLAYFEKIEYTIWVNHCFERNSKTDCYNFVLNSIFSNIFYVLTICQSFWVLVIIKLEL